MLSTVARVLVPVCPAVLRGLLLALSDMLDVLAVGIVTCDRCGLHLTFWSKEPRKEQIVYHKKYTDDNLVH